MASHSSDVDCQGRLFQVKGTLRNSGEGLLIFEFNQITPLPSVLQKILIAWSCKCIGIQTPASWRIVRNNSLNLTKSVLD